MHLYFSEKIKMDEIAMDDLDRPEDRQEEQQGEEETNLDERDESMVIIDTSNPDANVRGNLDAMREADRDLGRGIGATRRTYTEDKESLLREMGINVNKGDGPSSKAVFERLKVTENGKGQRVGEFEGRKIFVQREKRLVYTEDKKMVSKVTEFKELVKRAEA